MPAAWVVARRPQIFPRGSGPGRQPLLPVRYAALPAAGVSRLESGHFVQEEQPEAVTAAIRDFVPG